MSIAIEIRRGISADAAALADFGRRTYEETYEPDNDPRNLADHLSVNYGEQQQRRELESSDVFTLLAEEDGRLMLKSGEELRRSAFLEIMLLNCGASMSIVRGMGVVWRRICCRPRLAPLWNSVGGESGSACGSTIRVP